MPASDEAISVVCGADERFALPLAVMCYSLLYNARHPVNVYVLDTGLHAASKQRLREILDPFDGNMRITDVQEQIFADIQIQKKRLGIASLSRLLIDRVVPNPINKSIYIDADCLVLDDISKLWDEELGSAIIGATRDYVLPYFRARAGEPPTYIHGREEGTEHYFNAGVMVINLEKWRQHNVTERSIEYLERLDEPATFLDQDALNVVCREHWHPIDYAWNVWPDVKVAPEECSLFQAEPEQIAAIESTEVSIVHFAGDEKPWTYEDNEMPYASKYSRYLRDSGWFSELGYRAWLAKRAARYYTRMGRNYTRTGRMVLGRWKQNLTQRWSHLSK